MKEMCQEHTGERASAMVVLSSFRAKLCLAMDRTANCFLTTL